MDESDISAALPALSQQLIGIPFSYENSSTRVATVDTSSNEKASLQVELNGQTIDFIANADAIKALWSIPYAHDDAEVSIIIHNVGGTLLVDTSVIPPTTNDDSRKSGETLVNDCISAGLSLSRSDIILPHPENTQSHEELNHNIPTGAKIVDAVISSPSSIPIFSQGKDTSSSREQTNHPYLPPPEFYTKSVIHIPDNPRQFLPWTFSGLNMIVGSDALIIPPYSKNNFTVEPKRAPSDSAFKKEENRTDRFTVWFANATELRAKLNAHEAKVRPGSSVIDSCSMRQDSHDTINAERCHRLDNSSRGQEIDERDMNSQTSVIPSQMSRNMESQLRRLEYELNMVSLPQQDEFGDERFSKKAPCSSSAIVTVLDAYLDNIIANVPQLALCLYEKGFIQSIQLFDIHELPHLSSLRLDGLSYPSNEQVDPLFSPEIVETNASMLLNFLKYNCSQDHSTYLLRKQAGETTVQLYDVSTLSRHRKQQWLWWLAMTSYRFALRLKQFSKSIITKENVSTLRSLRIRQRNLLRNALELLEEHVDMGGNPHETITAALNESLADTYLVANDEEMSASLDDKAAYNDSNGTKAVASPSGGSSYNSFLTSSLSSFDSSLLHPYHSLRSDSLTKAQDYLMRAIDSLNKLFDCSASDSSTMTREKNDFLSSQLYGLNHKLINILLRLTIHYLKNYSSSNAMQSLRMLGRRLSDSLRIIKTLHLTNDDKGKEYMINLFYQSFELWEQCGRFSRSYAADGMWRDRGHAGGDDIIALLQDVQSTMSSVDASLVNYSTDITELVHDFNLNNLTGIIESSTLVDDKDIGRLSANAIAAAKQIMDKQKQIKRDEVRVLVASTHCFVRAICILEVIELYCKRSEIPISKAGSLFRLSSAAQSSHIRPLYGDACNEVGKIILTQVKNLLLLPPDPRIDMAAPYAPLLLSAEAWFIQGLRQFQLCEDQRNIAVLRCNLCQCSKLRANAAIALPRSGSCAYKHEHFSRDNHSELCLQDAINHLQLAHIALDQREADEKTWDMVSEELAASYLILGVKRRQSILGGGLNSMMPKVIRIQPGEERFIIDPMEKAITIYEQLRNRHQVAAAHYQLALFYSKVWMIQNNEGKTREKLEKAFRHFQLAHGYFLKHLLGNEPTFVILCLDLSQLYSSISSEAHCLIKALLCCADTCNAFSPRSVLSGRNVSRSQLDGTQTDDEWNDKMKTLSKTMDENVFSLLMNLVKLEKGNSIGRELVCFKDIYRSLLSLKMGSNDGNSDEFPIYKVLLKLRDELSPYMKNS